MDWQDALWDVDLDVQDVVFDLLIADTSKVADIFSSIGTFLNVSHFPALIAPSQVSAINATFKQRLKISPNKIDFFIF